MVTLEVRFAMRFAVRSSYVDMYVRYVVDTLTPPPLWNVWMHSKDQ